MKIGVAGYMGSGKTTLCRVLEEAGFARIDADEEAKNSMSRNPLLRHAIGAAFGSDLLCDNGIDFTLLSQRVFSRPDGLACLDAMVAPPLGAAFSERVASCSGPLVLDAAALPRWGIEALFDALWWVDAPGRVRRQRLHKRLPHLDGALVRERMEQQERLLAVPPSPPWFYLENRAGTGELERMVLRMIDGACPAQGRTDG